MLCISCQQKIPDGSLFCNHCGKRQRGTIAPRKRPKARRAKGSGSIVFIKGLSSPYRARYCGRNLGYFPTVLAAQDAIESAKASGPDLEYRNYTMQQVFDAVTSDRDWASRSDKYRADTKTTWKYMSELHNKLARDVRKEDFQNIIYRAQDEDKSQSHQLKLRVLAKKLCQFCVQHGIHSVDYSEGLKVNNNIKSQRVPFSDADLRAIYAHRQDRAAAIIWFLCATGCRPGELGKILRDDSIDTKRHGVWLAGSKTVAGRNRFVAIDPVTWEVFMRFYRAAAPGAPIFTGKNGGPWDVAGFRRYEFYPELESLGIPTGKYILYSCRHTFATLAERSGVDKATLQRAMGHEIGSTVTDDHYIDQVAHVDTALSEFNKLSKSISSIVSKVSR